MVGVSFDLLGSVEYQSNGRLKKMASPVPRQLYADFCNKICHERKSPLSLKSRKATGEHLVATVIRAARLAAILLRIGRRLRHADEGPERF